MLTLSRPDALSLFDDVINKIKKASAVFGHSTLAIEGKNGKVSITILDQKNPTANKYTITLNESNACEEVFSFVMVIGNLKMLPGDYTVSISSKLISHFKNTNLPVEYWIALEKTSTFSG